MEDDPKVFRQHLIMCQRSGLRVEVLHLVLEQHKREKTAVIYPKCVQDFAPGYKEFTIVIKAVFGGGYKIFMKQREYRFDSKEYLLKWVEYSPVLYTTAEEAEKDFKRVTGNPTVLFTPSDKEEKQMFYFP